MQHVVNMAHTRWLAANLVSGHLVHAGDHRAQPGQEQGSASRGRVDVWSANPD